MAVLATLHEDDVGVVLTVNVSRTFSAGETAVLRLTKPRGGVEVELSLTPAVGQQTATYTTTSSDFTEPGDWQAEAKVTAGTQVFHSDGGTIRVLRHFEVK